MFALHVAGAFRFRIHAKYVKTCIFTIWRVGNRACLHRTFCIHSGTAYMRNTTKTCIFTLWRVGKRAFLHILQWENGEIRQKRAFLPSGEWENVHFCTFYSGKTAKYVKNVHFHPLESGKTCISAHSTVGKRRNTSKTCIFTLWRVGKRAFLHILQWENGEIRQKRAFLPSGEWGNVHFCTFYSGKTAEYVKNVHFHFWRVGKRACLPRTSRMNPSTAYMQNTSKTCIF